MWRWLHSLPRAVRQQFHGPGASAGVCVEDLHENEIRKSYRDDTREQYDGKSHCKFSNHDNEEGKDQKGPHPEKHNFWDMVHGPCSTLEAIGWGGVIALGIQVGQLKCLHRKYQDREDGKKHCLLYKVVYALPSLGNLTTHLGVKNNVLPPDRNLKKKKQKEKKETGQERKYHCFLEEVVDALPPLQTFRNINPEIWVRKKEEKVREDTRQAKNKSRSPKVESLEAAFANFERVCKRYTATGKGIMGSQAAMTGNMKSAASLWEESSTLGHAKSQFNLAVCYETGQGVKKNLAEAMKYYTLAAEEDHTQAMYNLSLLYMEGTIHRPRDTNKAVTLLTRAAELGLIEAQRYLGVYYTEEDSEDVTKALHYLKMAADQLDAEAQYFLAMCYQFGYGMEENLCKAADLFNRSAESGYTEAIYNLGLFHLRGLGGLPQDRHCARTLLQNAADLGHQNAREELNQLATEIELEEHDELPPLLCNGRLTEEIHTNTDVSEKPENISFLLKLNSSVSSPSLTDLVRSNLAQCDDKKILYDPVSGSGTLSQIYTQLMVPRGISVSLTSWKELPDSPQPSESDSDSGVVFKFGSEDDTDVPFTDTLLDNVNVIEKDCKPTKYSGLQRRISTMPELHGFMTPCM